MTDQLLGVAQVAALLGVHQRTVYRLLTEEGLPSYRVGRVIRVRRGDVDEWLERRPYTPRRRDG